MDLLHSKSWGEIAFPYPHHDTCFSHMWFLATEGKILVDDLVKLADEADEIEDGIDESETTNDADTAEAGKK